MTRGLTPAAPNTVVEPLVLRAANKPTTPASMVVAASTSPSASTPLDLSVRRSPEHQDEKEDRMSPTPSSLPPPQGSPRSRGSGSPRTRSAGPSQSVAGGAVPPAPAELALRLAELPPPPVPGVLVKQGVSRYKVFKVLRICQALNSQSFKDFSHLKRFIP